jgi:hypothetical protein
MTLGLSFKGKSSPVFEGFAEIYEILLALLTDFFIKCPVSLSKGL